MKVKPDITFPPVRPLIRYIIDADWRSQEEVESAKQVTIELALTFPL